MLLLLSPAKSLDEAPFRSKLQATQPALQIEADKLATKLASLSVARLQSLMGISKELATLNQARFKSWSIASSKQAIFLFNGEAYRGLGATSLEADDLRFAQRHLRILSGLYGVLRPGDRIVPHRLEMGTKLAMGKAMKNLYDFWGDCISTELRAAIGAHGDDVVVNLASAEYFKSVHTAGLDVPVVTPEFKEEVRGELRMVGVYAKHQRGAMVRWAIQSRLTNAEDLKQYDGGGYRFRPELSTGTNWLFTR